MRQTAKAHDIEMRDAERRDIAKLNVDVKSHDTIIKTQTQLDIEKIKGEFALMLAQLDERSLRAASGEAIERAI